jgi:hypothetical protein
MLIWVHLPTIIQGAAWVSNTLPLKTITHLIHKYQTLISISPSITYGLLRSLQLSSRLCMRIESALYKLKDPEALLQWVSQGVHRMLAFHPKIPENTRSMLLMTISLNALSVL